MFFLTHKRETLSLKTFMRSLFSSVRYFTLVKLAHNTDHDCSQERRLEPHFLFSFMISFRLCAELITETALTR